MWIFPWIKLSWHSCSIWSKLGWLIDSGNSTVKCYLPLIRKDSISHIHGLAVYVKKGLSLSWDLSPENSADSSLCFRQALLHSVSYFFFLYWSPSLSLCTVFDSVSPNMDEVFSIIPSANVFVFREITDRPGELYYNFSTPNDLT